MSGLSDEMKGRVIAALTTTDKCFQEIADEVGCSRSTVGNLERRFDLRPHKRGFKPGSEESSRLAQAAVEMRQANPSMTIIQIAKSLGCSENFVHKFAGHIKRVVVPEWHALSKADAEAGMSNPEISRKYGISKSQVQRVLKSVQRPVVEKKCPREIALRKQERRKEALKENNEKMLAAILALKNAGKKPYEISEEVGRSIRSIQEICRRVGQPFPQYRPPVSERERPPRREKKNTYDKEFILKRKTLTAQEIRINNFKMRIARVVASDRIARRSPPVTLPKVSILEGSYD